MIVTTWILFSFFGLMSILFTQKLLFKKLNGTEALILFVSVIIVAIAAGVLFGGLTLL